MGQIDEKRLSFMSTMLLNLGYVSFNLIPGWIARAPLNLESPRVTLVKGNANCEISLINAGGGDAQSKLEIFYDTLLEGIKRRGKHVDDLADECDFEIIAEADDSKGTPLMQHIFVRPCANIIVLATLTDFMPSEEEEIRQMLSTLQPGDEFISGEDFALLPVTKAIQSWDQIGSLAIFNGAF